MNGSKNIVVDFNSLDKNNKKNNYLKSYHYCANEHFMFYNEEFIHLHKFKTIVRL